MPNNQYNYYNNNRGNYNYNNFNYRDNNYQNNYDNYRNEGTYQRKLGNKFELNEIKDLNRIVAENIEIINEMKSAYPGITQLECASVFKRVKAGNSQNIFEIMNQIHRDIITQITLNEYYNKNRKNYLLQIDPYEIIDPFYNNPEHIKMMKYYKIYTNEDKDKLPLYIKKILKDNYFAQEDKKRRKLIKYPDGGFNYIPIYCSSLNDGKKCDYPNCPYSHNDDEVNYHPLFYKTQYKYSEDEGELKLYSKTATNLFNDFRIIYNYKNENIINLLKLLEEKKIAKIQLKDLLKKNYNKSFNLETFKTLECRMTCKKNSHLCYYYHNLSERRRPPTLYRYTNEMCPDQKYNNKGNIKTHCKNGDFCNKCHSRYEYYYHKLFFGKAIICIRDKKNGKCIYEDTCYGYHPYKEHGYKKTRKEIIQERKDELIDKYTEECELLNGLVEKYRCQSCEKFTRKFKFYFLIKCEHIICYKCFDEIDKEKKCKCPVCKKKFDSKKEKEDFIQLDIKKSAQNIDELIIKNFKEKKEKEKQEKENQEKEKKENKKQENEEQENEKQKKEKINNYDNKEDKNDNNNNEKENKGMEKEEDNSMKKESDHNESEEGNNSMEKNI